MIQIGYTSNLEKTLDAFPEADVEYIFSPVEVMNFTIEEINNKVNSLLKAAKGNEHRFSIVVADLEIGTPDENIVEIYKCCK